MQVKAIACELPKESGQPLSRYSRQDLVREVARRGIAAKISGRTIWRFHRINPMLTGIRIAAKISGRTIWRWLDEDAIRPWQHRSWIFPRDPHFETKAA